MWTSGQSGPGAARRAPAGVPPVPPRAVRSILAGSLRGAASPCPVQSFLFGHSRAEVVYDCR
ncbi:hypothetical protein Arub01_18220 [Actinomadura rubrobrunea]|uniref:Uncharacterized protein n=1 Tax=Actinomadura rubrobrunea TaxID=115335 RepID=A0A9W6PVA0_9ACTN|nr:hypothetical protein [Actinomadura rubrobrunea]GLW63578.1 hypothetical protein Arub01_18220 [Actinomadura rubrobrunea]